MQNYKIDSFLTRHMNTKKDLAVIKYNMNNNEDYKKYNYEILNNKKTDFSKKYLNDLEKFKTIEIYKKKHKNLQNTKKYFRLKYKSNERKKWVKNLLMF